MAQPTVAQMRTVGQTLVMDTSTTNPGLSSTDWLVLLNDALFAYAAAFPNLLELTGLLGTATTSSGTQLSTLTLNATTTSVRSITNAFIRSTQDLQRAEFMDLLRRATKEPTQSIPTHYAIVSAVSSAPGVASTSHVYSVRWWPIPDATYSVDFYGNVQPVTLTGDSDYTPFQEAEARTIARMAAVEAARLLGRSQAFVQGVAAPLPDEIKAAMGLQQIETRPKPVPGKPSV